MGGENADKIYPYIHGSLDTQNSSNQQNALFICANRYIDDIITVSMKGLEIIKT